MLVDLAGVSSAVANTVWQALCDPSLAMLWL
ncbi:hypothetical protein SAMN05444158_1515 [Bradyrhizobium canariense]|uniref:Uncharacterized protein n=1 Tax=Bradyrhizobium canariense TaxID=255045 RepID=A0A1H1QTW4_9BRAD|nr:hypothetical protein SAMN05444158_1515 [Bradyrhizobium canariense]